MTQPLDYELTPPTADEATPGRARRVGVLLLIIAAVLWSLSGPMVKLVGEVPALGFALWRSMGAFLAAGLFVGARAMFTGRRTDGPRPAPMFVAGLLFTANVTLLILAMREGTAARGILLQYTGPAWVALLGWLLFKRKIGPRTMAALGLAGLGVVIMLAGTSGNLAGSLYGVASGFSYGSLILALDYLDRANATVGRPPADPASIVMWMNLAAVAVLLPLALATGTAGLDLPVSRLASVVVFGVIQLAIPYALFQLALGRVGPVDAALIALLEPVLNPIWTWLAVGEQPDPATFVGGGLLLAALVVEATKKRHVPAI